MTTQGYKDNKEVTIKHQCFYECTRCTIFCSLKFDAMLSTISNMATPLKTLYLDHVIKDHYVIPTNIEILPSTPFYKCYFTLRLPDFGINLYWTTLPIETTICWGCSRLTKTRKHHQIPVHECNGRFKTSINKRSAKIFSQSGQLKYPNIYEPKFQRIPIPPTR